jgi:tetratricopeptide (TPR) repeat protein
VSSDEVAGLGREVKAYLDQRRYDEALSSAEHFASVAPQSARAWLTVSLAQRDLGHLPEALQAVDKAISLNATLAAAWQVKGVILHELERFAEAVEALRQALERIALERDPLVGSVWVVLGFDLQRLLRYEEALVAFDQAWSLDRQTLQVLRGRIATYGALQRYEEGLALAEEYVRRAPEEVAAWRLRARFHMDLQRYEEALAGFAQARQLEAPTPEVLEAEITAYCALHRFAEALPLSEDYLRDAPDDATAWRTRGAVLTGLQRYEEALAAYDHARELQAPATSVLHGRITAYCALRRFAEALPLSEEYVRLAPDDVTAWGSHAAVLTGLRRYEEAIAAYDRALALQPDLLWALERRAAALWWSGHRRQALRALLHFATVSATKRRAERVRRAQQRRR